MNKHWAIAGRSVRFGPPMFEWRCLEDDCDAQGKCWSIWGRAYDDACAEAVAHYYQRHYSMPKAIQEAMANLQRQISDAAARITKQFVTKNGGDG